MSDVNSQNQDNYDDLLVSIEAGKDILNLLIAVCDDSDCRDRIISDYEAELEPDIRRYRVELARGEPSLRSALANLVAQEAYLQQGEKPLSLSLVWRNCGFSNNLAKVDRNKKCFLVICNGRGKDCGNFRFRLCCG